MYASDEKNKGGQNERRGGGSRRQHGRGHHQSFQRSHVSDDWNGHAAQQGTSTSGNAEFGGIPARAYTKQEEMLSKLIGHTPAFYQSPQAAQQTESRSFDFAAATTSLQATQTNYNTAMMVDDLEPTALKVPAAKARRTENEHLETMMLETEPSALELEANAVGEDVADLESEVEEAVAPGTATAKKRKKHSTAWLSRNAGPVIYTITSESIAPVSVPVSWDTEAELLCSYNWQDPISDTNVIFVPGAPPKYAPPVLPYTLPASEGWHLMDQNHARQPRFTYKPMFQALSIMNPNLKLNDVDVIADRNPLRNLLEFSQGKNVPPFRLDLYLVDNTLVVVRRERKWWQRAGGAGGQTDCGYTFEDHFTRMASGLEDATNHYRVLRYPMGGLNVVVRAEVDASYEAPNGDGIATEDNFERPSSLAPPERLLFNFRAPLQVIPRGQIMPNSQMAELKTQAIIPGVYRGTVACKDQLWFGRTPHLITGRYTKGSLTLESVRYENGKELCAGWERNAQDGLQKLVTLLRELRDFLKEMKGFAKAVVLVKEEKVGPLLIREMENKDWAVDHYASLRHWGIPGTNARRANTHRAPAFQHQTQPRFESYQGHGRGASHQAGHATPSSHPRGSSQRGGSRSSEGGRGGSRGGARGGGRGRGGPSNRHPPPSSNTPRNQSNQPDDSHSRLR